MHTYRRRSRRLSLYLETEKPGTERNPPNGTFSDHLTVDHQVHDPYIFWQPGVGTHWEAPTEQGGQMLLRHAALDYLRARSGEIGVLTRRSHSYVLDSFTLYCGTRMLLLRVQPVHVQRWVADNPQWAPSTARLRISVVKTFFAWCVTNKLVKVNPVIGIHGPRQPRGIPRELDAEDFWKILDAAPDKRAAAMVSLIFREGVRRGGLCALNVEDVDRDVILLTEKGGHQRVMPLSHPSSIAIALYLGEWPVASGPVFRNYHTGRRLHPETIGRIITQCFWDAGVKQRAWDGRSAHAGRHSFAGAMIDNGADIRTVSDALGHEHESTTAVYLRRRRTPAQIRPHLPTYT